MVESSDHTRSASPSDDSVTGACRVAPADRGPQHPSMNERLYYHDSFLYEFEANLVEIISADSRPALILDRTAFYPTSGGQVFDTGWLGAADRSESERLRVVEVAEDEDGRILHFVAERPAFGPGTPMRGLIDIERRRDHMQQHSGQHVLSAAFVRLFDTPTVSFHMGGESSSIDLDTKNLTPAQLRYSFCHAGRGANNGVEEDPIREAGKTAPYRYP